jgi:GNAT superfamily N-acetyltransferase
VSPPAFAIRPARPSDVPAVVAMVHELAEYERAPEQCHLTDAQLHTALFGEACEPNTERSGEACEPHIGRSADAPALFGHVAVDARDEPFGFALWFLNFSTWEGVHGIYLEDLYVRPQARGSGAGRALLATLASLCVERGYRRLDWWVLHWNPAREFYASIGASAMDEWIPYRLEGDGLHSLATSPDGPAAPQLEAT